MTTLNCYIIFIYDTRDGSIKEMDTYSSSNEEDAINQLESIQNNLKFNGEDFLFAAMTKGWY